MFTIGAQVTRRIIAIPATVVVVLLAAASPAWAHATVSPEQATKGGDAVLTFVVPNEEETATTTKVKVQFPSDHPIAEALVAQLPGWTFSVSTRRASTPIKTDSGEVREYVGAITWTATGSGIGVGSFGQFSVSVGLPSDADELQFPTIQTYSDGKTVNWVQPAPVGGPEPDDPVPVLKLTAPTETAVVTDAGTRTGTTRDDTAKTIAIIALIVAGLGLCVGIGGIALRRKKPA